MLPATLDVLADPTSRPPDVSSNPVPRPQRARRPDASRLAPSRPGIVPLDDHPDLLRRIRGEFREMPGLHLTLGQAARLFDLREDACRSALGMLTHEGFLAETSRGVFHRNDISP
jgi:hypothetical protein